MSSLYMVIDVTSMPETKIRFIADNERALLLSRIYMNNHPGRTCVAPVMEGRGFSKLNLKTLQYLFWNTFQKTPCDDYEQLVKDCLSEASFLPINIDTISTLNIEKELSVNISLVHAESSAPKAPNIKAENTTPKKTSTCGYVWEICENYYLKDLEALQKDHKAFRNQIMVFCEKEGINLSTTSVQFSKWKKTKTGS